MLELIEAQQPPFDKIVAVDDVVAGSDRVDEGVDRFILQLVVQIHRIYPAGMPAQPVGDHLVRGERIENMGEDVVVVRKPRGHLGGGVFPHLPVVVIEIVQHFFFGSFGGPEFHGTEDLVEEDGPGIPAHRLLFEQDLLLALRELMRPVAAQAGKVMAVMGQFRIGEQGFRLAVGYLVPFQFEKDGLGPAPADQLDDLLVQGAGLGVSHAGGKIEKGESGQFAEGGIEVLKSFHQNEQLGCALFPNLPAIGLPD